MQRGGLMMGGPTPINRLSELAPPPTFIRWGRAWCFSKKRAARAGQTTDQ